MIEELLKKVKAASEQLSLIEPKRFDKFLTDLAGSIENNTDFILNANEKDLALMDKANPLYDRLKLTSQRLLDIAGQMRKLAELPSPLHKVLSHEIRPNGLDVSRISVPFGVIGIIYEARPNVTFDVSALCLKAGSACVLKGSASADNSNKAIVTIIHSVLKENDMPEDAVVLLPANHEVVSELLHARKYVDLLIPRGGRKLIDFVRDNATVNVIETGAGTCHVFFDKYGDVNKGARIINNAKTRRVSVCNALDCLLIDETRLSDLPSLCIAMAEKHVVLYADAKAYSALSGKYPDDLLRHSTADCYGHEFLDYAMAVVTVADVASAVEYIRKYGSGHSDSIVTENAQNGNFFLSAVDAACVYLNAPTSFSDGGELGLGAEIGISTQKLHARGPMGLDEITTYKWVIKGNGQVRP